MAKLLEAIEALAKGEATKALAESLKKDLADLVNVEAAEIPAALEKAMAIGKAAEAQVVELTTAAKALGDQVEGAKALQAKVTAYEGEKRETILSGAFGAWAKENGLPDVAVATARKLADLSKVEVDLATAKVTGLTKEIAEGLKKDHPVLFAAPVAAVPPLPAGAGGTPALPQVGDNLPGGTGLFVQAGRL